MQALEIGKPEYDDVIQVMGTLSLDFSKLEMDEVYVVQHASSKNIRIRENDVAYQDKKETRKAKEHKFLLRKKEDDIKAQEQGRLTLEEAICYGVAEFPIEEEQEE